jgi:polyhydroxybutyrate depolymerase
MRDGSETMVGARPPARRRGAYAALLALLVLAAAGCADRADMSAPACAGRSGVAGHRVVEIPSGGLTRSFRLAVPSSYDGIRPTPLVLDFHGVLSTAAEQEGRSQLTAAGEANGFLVATPDGFGESWNAEVCCGEAMAEGVDDLGFVGDMVETIEREYCVDEQRVYAAGYSNGGLLAFYLACRASDRFAAIASVDAAAVDFPCIPSRPVPVILFHGTADPVVPYSVAGPSVELWRRIDGCGGTSTATFERGDSSCESFDDCDADAAVEICTTQGGGHTWPGGGDFPAFLGHKSADLSATAEMWRFFAAHPLPAMETLSGRRGETGP